MMNAFCFVGLDIGHYNITVYIIDEAEIKLANFTIKMMFRHVEHHLVTQTTKEEK